MELNTAHKSKDNQSELSEVMPINAKIYIAGHRGMVGSALVRKLEKEGYTNLVFRTSKELDLRNQMDVEDFFKTEQPEYVFLAAAKVGGIHANNTYRGEFLYDNLMMECNIIHSAKNSGVKPSPPSHSTSDILLKIISKTSWYPSIIHIWKAVS